PYLKYAVKELELENAKALDLGCGEGRNAIYLARMGVEVKAIDAAVNGVKKLDKIACDKGLDIEAIAADLRNYDFTGEKYDIIVASTILGHLEKETRERVTADIKKSLKPGGILFATVFTVDDPGYSDLKDNISSETSFGVRHYYKYAELKEKFSGLRIKKYIETKELDTNHGDPHYHGYAMLIGEKPKSNE
ncbi:MAG: class I SAM-dependent methyltransferase, partial [Bacteroidota bacterium]